MLPGLLRKIEARKVETWADSNHTHKSWVRVSCMPCVFSFLHHRLSFECDFKVTQLRKAVGRAFECKLLAGPEPSGSATAVGLCADLKEGNSEYVERHDLSVCVSANKTGGHIDYCEPPGPKQPVRLIRKWI